MNLKLAGASALVAAIAMAGPALAAGKNQNPKAFIDEAVRGDISEVTLGDLAQQKAQNQQVKELGKVLSEDHAKNKDAATALAKSLGVTPPDQPTTDAQQEKTKLEKLKGAAFDREFVNYMIKDHKKDIQEFTAISKSNNAQLAEFAKQTLPDLNKHLADAQAVQGQMKTAKK